MTLVCKECGCPWVIASGYSVTGWTTVPVDPNRPWLGTTRQERTTHVDKPHWRFDWTAYERLTSYPPLDQDDMRALEQQLGRDARITSCALVYAYDPSLSLERPILFVQPVLGSRLHELTSLCRAELGRVTSARAAAHADAVQFFRLPLTSDGAVDRDRLTRGETERLARPPRP